MNRIDRLTAIIIFLQGRQRVSVQELSERYSISLRTVYRDLAALQEAGVPIGSESGEGYYIVKGYHLPPVMFDRNEASSLLAGERLMQKWRDIELGKSYLSALDKIRSILPADDREYLEKLDRYIKVLHYPDEKNGPLPDDRIFSYLQNAIIRKEVLDISYFSPSSQDKTRRMVEPLGLLLMGNHWYLAGWCRLRKDYRMFRLDRFEEYKLTGTKLPDHPEHTLKEFHDRNLNEKQELVEIVVRFKYEMVRYIGDQKYRHGWAWEKKVDGGLEMTFLSSHPDYFARWILIWGSGVQVRKPDSVIKQIKTLVNELYKHYST